MAFPHTTQWMWGPQRSSSHLLDIHLHHQGTIVVPISSPSIALKIFFGSLPSTTLVRIFDRWIIFKATGSRRSYSPALVPRLSSIFVRSFIFISEYFFAAGFFLGSAL